MGRHYKHLSFRERLQIEAWLRAGWSKAEIACELGRHISTIYRELERGKGIQRTTDLIDYETYIPDIAQAKYEDTFSGKGPDLKIGNDHKLANYLGEVIANGNRSPEAALGEIKAKGLHFDTVISCKTLYRYIDLGIIPGVTNKDLPIKRNRKKHNNKVRRAARSCPGKSIEERPAEIGERQEPGHWEGDSVVSNKEGSERVFVLTERVTRNYLMLKVKNGEAAKVVEALDGLERRLGPVFAETFKSITVDNGSEFADCAGMERSCIGSGPRTTIYYCHPYSSFEKGSVERQNEMVRRKHPKGTNFSNVSQEEIKATEDWINNYPRKMFNYHTSAELFAASFPEAARLFSTPA